MPRTSILSLVVLPLILATVVFVWTPGIVVQAAAAGAGPPRADEAADAPLAPSAAGAAALTARFLALLQADFERPEELEALEACFDPTGPLAPTSPALEARLARWLRPDPEAEAPATSTPAAQTLLDHTLLDGRRAVVWCPAAGDGEERTVRLVHRDQRWWITDVRDARN